jgi:transposase-like protein
MGQNRKKSPPLRAVNPPKPGGGQSSAQSTPDPEVVARPERRHFSAEYKLRILREVDACRDSGDEVGAILRREGLYSSHLTDWRRAREQGELQALAPRKRGRREKLDPSQKELQRLQRQLARTQRELSQARAIISIQKKVSELLGIPLNAPELMEDEED